MQKYYSLQHVENHVQWTKLSNTVMKNMGGFKVKKVKMELGTQK
jgi:hypothetical protein